ncbi:MAG: hypothetical protein IKE42_21485 [Aquamicrobium sp.]|uniref:hypothetical protein n=1 Tax=Mesorhizobium sp. Pch-S TaxID=2082387 RepID=UPI001010E221|nr:hypothetical protein [Mesorhizobium sp. Pch-S]MBR2690433.1 hypothetical protein [Aquamicrobium sp.]QAZ43094.1 hypothetical protein C1M53_09010 [Mesorhizobium sp. Pch-S]
MSDMFDHFANTRHKNWTIIGVVDPKASTMEVSTVEIFRPGIDEPVLSIAVSDLPQFIAGLTASALPGDLTRT